MLEDSTWGREHVSGGGAWGGELSYGSVTLGRGKRCCIRCMGRGSAGFEIPCTGQRKNPNLASPRPRERGGPPMHQKALHSSTGIFGRNKFSNLAPSVRPGRRLGRKRCTRAPNYVAIYIVHEHPLRGILNMGGRSLPRSRDAFCRFEKKTFPPACGRQNAKI